MKAFLVGLLALLAVAVFTAIGFLLFPFLIVLFWLVRLIAIAVLLILAIWLLGKFILFLWKKMK